MTEEKAGDLLHDGSTLQLSQTGTDCLDAVEALVILKEQNVLLILHANFSRPSLEQEIAQVAAKKCSFRLAWEKGMPGTGGDMR